MTDTLNLPELPEHSLRQQAYNSYMPEVLYWTADQMRAYATAAVLAERESRWLPIATAPKDGTEVLLYAPTGVHEGKPYPERVTLGTWLAPSDVPSLRYCDGYAPEEVWEEFDAHWSSWDGGFSEEHPATHWMPLPPPPKESE